MISQKEFYFKIFPWVQVILLFIKDERKFAHLQNKFVYFYRKN